MKIWGKIKTWIDNKIDFSYLKVIFVTKENEDLLKLIATILAFFVVFYINVHYNKQFLIGECSTESER